MKARLASIIQLALSSLAAALIFSAAPAKAADPIRIGFGMSLTGPLAANGKNVAGGDADLGRRHQC